MSPELSQLIAGFAASGILLSMFMATYHFLKYVEEQSQDKDHDDYPPEH